MSSDTHIAVTPMTQTLSEYISAAATRELPPAVVEKTRHHILDTLAAIISGSRLRAGELAIAYVKRLGGTPEATLIGTPSSSPRRTRRWPTAWPATPTRPTIRTCAAATIRAAASCRRRSRSPSCRTQRRRLHPRGRARLRHRHALQHVARLCRPERRHPFDPHRRRQFRRGGRRGGAAALRSA